MFLKNLEKYKVILASKSPRRQYLLNELATSGEIKNNNLIFNSKLSSANINKKLRQYANTFVLCSECGKPDTKIITEKNISFLKCLACGAKNHIKY